MPGICGAVSATCPSEHGLLLRTMIARMRHHPWYQEQTLELPQAGAAFGRLTLGFVNKTPQPVWNEDRTVCALMEGEIYDAEPLRNELASLGHELGSVSDAEIVLHGFESFGEKYFARLNGTFVAALFDRVHRLLVLVNDRFGMKPLYYAQTEEGVLFGTEIKALMAAPGLSRKPSSRGLAQFFTFGQFLGEDTFLEDVHLLPAASILVFNAPENQVSITAYHRLGPSAAPARRDDDWIDLADKTFLRAVERRTANTSSLGLSLSGGLDSRTILGVIDHDRVPVTTVSMGIRGSLDHDCAVRLAALTNKKHHCHFLDNEFLANFQDHMRQMVRLTDGHYLSQCIVMPTLPVYRQLGIEVLLRGHAGELLHLDKAYSFSVDREGWSLADGAALEDWLYRHLAFLTAPGAGSLFKSIAAAEHAELARSSLRGCLAASEGFDPPQQRIAHMFLTQRLRRETAMSMMEFGSLVETRLPYMDNDLIDLLMAMPPRLRVGDRLQAETLRRHRPEFLDVVNANIGAPLGAGPLTRRLAKAKLRVFSKLRVPGYQPYERLGLWLRRELKPLVQELLLSDRSLGRGVFEPDTVRTLVRQHWQRSHNHTYLLLALMIFETGQREFVDGQACPAVVPGAGLATAS